jgi:predicted phage baseplate assembly protein
VPLQAPNLDNRTFDELVSEARRRIPRYTPQWTDFNDSDPGITLVQLFAWFTETMLHQLNQVPERNYIKFLQLLNMELRPAQPATAHLTFNPAAGPEFQPIARRAQIQAQPPTGGDPLIFETEEGLDLVHVPLTDVQVFDSGAFTVVTLANEPDQPFFRPLGWLPQVGNALYLGFEPPATAPKDKPIAGLFPQEMRWRVFLPSESQAGLPQSCRDVRQPPTPPVTLVWEYKATQDAARWRRLNVFKDASSAFTREGYILVEGPSQIAATTEGKMQTEPRLWLRVRLASGTYPAGRAPEIDFIRPNVVSAVNLTTEREEIVGKSEGTPNQLFELRRTPVLKDSLSLSIEVPDEPPEQWQPVDDFLHSARDDTHYTLNHATGLIHFGDGEHGRIPVAGAEIIAREYRYGGMSAGNVAAGLINAPLTNLPGVDKVTNERAAVGGRDEQKVEELKEQAPALLRSRHRAVTAEDFTALAMQAGGVARAKAIQLAHPDFRGVEVPGVVTVVIVPDTEDMPPRPSSDQIRQVCQYLENFRLITTEIYVKGPEYQTIQVEAQVAAQPYAAFDAVERDVIKAINAFLSPLGAKPQAQPAQTSSTQEAQGWEFGKALYPTSLFSVILGVRDVTAVLSLSLSVNGQPHEDLKQAIVLPPDGLVYGGEHVITVVHLTDL